MKVSRFQPISSYTKPIFLFLATSDFVPRCYDDLFQLVPTVFNEDWVMGSPEDGSGDVVESYCELQGVAGPRCRLEQNDNMLLFTSFFTAGVHFYLFPENRFRNVPLYHWCLFPMLRKHLKNLRFTKFPVKGNLLFWVKTNFTTSMNALLFAVLLCKTSRWVLFCPSQFWTFATLNL